MAKPAKALAGSTVRVSTAADTASSEAVKRGNEFKMTATIAAANIAKRCQASLVSPAGIGQNQMPSAKTNGMARIELSAERGHGCAHLRLFSAGRGSRRAKPRSALKVDGPAAYCAVLGLNNVFPLKGILPGDTGETASPSQESAYDAIPGSHPLTLQFAINLVTVLVSPHTPALHAGETVGEADHLRPESDS